MLKLHFQMDRNRIFKVVPETDGVVVVVHATTVVKRATSRVTVPIKGMIPIHRQECSQNLSHVHRCRERPKHFLLDKLQIGRKRLVIGVMEWDT